MRDENGVNRGFGFVKFVNAQEAYIALAQVPGKKKEREYCISGWKQEEEEEEGFLRVP